MSESVVVQNHKTYGNHAPGAIRFCAIVIHLLYHVQRPVCDYNQHEFDQRMRMWTCTYAQTHEVFKCNKACT